ncbi:MAG: alpha/beta fold hydrolase [Candidatus Methanofastidiosia archaeon]
MKTLVFIHGAGGSENTWIYQKKHFEKRYKVIVPNLMKICKNNDISNYVRDVLTFLCENQIEKCVMIGHSMGGAITLKFGLTYPKKLKAIVLVGTGAKLRVHPMIFEVIEKDHERAANLITEFALYEKTPRELALKISKDILKTPKDVLLKNFKACDKFDQMDEISGIEVPTLIVCGSEDRLTPLKYSSYLKNKIENSQLEVIERAGHMVMLEQHEEFNEKLDEFLEHL